MLAMTTSGTDLATHLRVRALPTTTLQKNPASKREAKRRKAHESHCRAERGCALLRSAPAFRRFTAALTTGYHPDGSAPEPGFLKARRPRCFAGSPHDALS
jgi:hypothetical protein